MNGVAAEVAEEVFVFFEDGDVVAVAGEEIAEHHAGGASTYDAAAGFGERRCGVRHRCDEVSKGGRLRQKSEGRRSVRFLDSKSLWGRYMCHERQK